MHTFCDTCLRHIVACTCCPTCKGPHSEVTHPTKLNASNLVDAADAMVRGLPLGVHHAPR